MNQSRRGRLQQERLRAVRENSDNGSQPRNRSNDRPYDTEEDEDHHSAVESDPLLPKFQDPAVN